MIRKIMIRKIMIRKIMIREIMVILLFCLIAALNATASAQTADVVSTREMSDINWMEFKEVSTVKDQHGHTAHGHA